jgi:hypothetical protein
LEAPSSDLLRKSDVKFAFFIHLFGKLPWFLVASSNPGGNKKTAFRLFFLEAPPRFELGNKGFADLCLTTWLWCRFGAGYEIRTRDFHLGKVTLYH